MAVYFDYKLSFPAVSNHQLIACHNSYPLIAVASSREDNAGGLVSLHLDEGELLESSTVQRSSPVSTLSWHPTKKALAIGWENSEACIWNEHDQHISDAVASHKGAISVLEWNATGSRLITGDKKGTICIWKVDQKGNFQQAPMHRHEIQSGIVKLVFRSSFSVDMATELAAAAKAAVSGDEKALEMFSRKKPSGSQSKFNLAAADSIQLFFSTESGTVHYINDKGKCHQRFKVDGFVKYLFYHESKDVVLSITDNLMLLQHSISGDGETTELSKVKLSGNPAKANLCMAGPGLLACATSESIVRVIGFDNDENFVLRLDPQFGFETGELVTCLSYSHHKGILAGGTNMKRIAMWKCDPNFKSSNSSDEKLWKLQKSSFVDTDAIAMTWGAGRGLLTVNGGSHVTLLSESIMNSHYNQGIGAVQVSPKQLSIELHGTSQKQDLKCDIHIRGVYVTKTNTVVWNGKKVAVYEVSVEKSLVRVAGSFNCESHIVQAYEQSLYMADEGKITVRTFQGTVKQELPFTEQEGDPMLIDVHESFMAVCTNKNVIKVFDLSRREARQHGNTKYLDADDVGNGSPTCIRCNCNGSRVAFMLNKDIADANVYIWNAEIDAIQSFDFKEGKGQSEANENLKIAQEQLTKEIKDRSPLNIFWDAIEPKLFLCQTTSVLASKPKDGNSGRPAFSPKISPSIQQSKSNGLVVSLFSSSEYGVIAHGYFPMEENHSELLGLDIPYCFIVKKTVQESEAKQDKPDDKFLVARKTLRDFAGLEDSNASVIKAMINFSYLSAIGNMDEAFKCIKAIKSGTVWENMARMCVKTKRLDVASVCLGNMGNARAAMSVREAMKEPELDARVAMLAIQLEMLDDAERLYKECNRYDLLNFFYQATNNWIKALETAENQDRIHLRTTYYNYGKYLESVGNFSAAMQQYELSDTFRFEVPRMLFEDTRQLETYIHKSNDPKLKKWWAQYLESIGEMDKALQFYENAEDNLSLVRVFCYCGELDKAEKICNESGDRAACYHLARQYENQDNHKTAIHFFSRAQAYSNAIRLAKENSLDNELVNLALLSTPQDMIEAAKYFEDTPNMQDKAIMLYHKSGSLSKAVELAFETEQFDALQQISVDLDDTADVSVINKCAQFFIDHGQFDKAVNLLVAGGRFHEAIEMCLDNHVMITEDLAEKMTLPKDTDRQQERTEVLEKMAECAFHQGSYHLATKKFTQAGNKIKAMKSLLKSGDTEKIVFFAGVSRQREIYVMAANYLQSLDWRRDPEIMKNIIGFYTRGRALESLAGFYDACAQVEIDEYQNYEKALGALAEAHKCLMKSKPKNPSHHEERMSILKHRITLMKKFVHARKIYEETPEESVKHLSLLLEEPDLDISINLGDVYSILIEHYAGAQRYQEAYELMEDLQRKQRSINISFYVNIQLIEKIHKSLGIPMSRGYGAEEMNGQMNGHGENDEDDSVGEEISEDYT